MFVKEVRQSTTANPDAIWQRWVNVSSWPEQDNGMEAVRLDGPLAVGTKIIMKPKGSKETGSTITVLDHQNFRFTSEAKIPFGYLRFEHEIPVHESGKTEFLHRVTIKGPLTPILRKVFADKMVADLPEMLSNIARLAESGDSSAHA
jgi:hypothetical protein